MHAKYEKISTKIPVSLFLYNTGPNLAQSFPQRPHPLSFFFPDFNKMCWGIQLILITCVAMQLF